MERIKMNSKMFVCLCRIVAVVVTAFVISGCTSVDVSGRNTGYASAIQSVLEQDSESGKITGGSVDMLLKSSQAKYSNMKKIDLSKCPPEFQASYISHMNAWAKIQWWVSEIIEFNERYNSVKGVGKVALRMLLLDFGAMAESEADIKKIRELCKEIDAEIMSTWNEVLKVAAKYDVDVSKYK